MNIPSIQIPANLPSMDIGLIGKESVKKPTGENSFGSILQAFTDMYKETGQNIQVAQDMQLDLALGKTDDIVGLTLAMEKANSSLNFTVQITNRVLEAYKEIMRLQM